NSSRLPSTSTRRAAKSVAITQRLATALDFCRPSHHPIDLYPAPHRNHPNVLTFKLRHHPSTQRMANYQLALPRHGN
ncbi:hypothetical protein PTTG_10094, partial [Puccinia triticina 1-1 BBBD Race 1]